MTGGRIQRVLHYVTGDEFCLTTATVWPTSTLPRWSTSVAASVGSRRHRRPAAGRFGALEIEAERVIGFAEKPPGDGGWINGGFFVLSPEIGRYLGDDSTIWEREPLEGLARDGQLSVYTHAGFWQTHGYSARHAAVAGTMGGRRRAVDNGVDVDQTSEPAGGSLSPVTPD